MYLKKLEIHGFKSFAKKTALEFEPGIVSIVGPNGSGKSNLADCLRWVFGEQSMKLLRGKKSDDVIFAGSDNRSRLGFAEVQVFFDNRSRRMPIDYSEVAIARRLYRDKPSEYLINGNAVRLLDIQELLAKSGFGNTSYHVIGQGLIDQLILSGPVGVKELIEEASGIKPYYVKRERALRRLEHTEANLGQVRALVKEIEPRLRSLRRQTKKFEQRAQIEKDLQDAQVLYYSQAFRALLVQDNDVSAKLGVFDKQVRELVAEIAELRTTIETQEKQTMTQGQDYEKLKSDLEQVHKQKLALQEELAVVRGRLRVAREQGEKNEVNVDWKELRSKFRLAYDSLRQLVGHFSQDEAVRVQALFSEVAKMIGAAEESGEQGRIEDGLAKLKTEEVRLNRELEDYFKKIQKVETDLAKYTSEESEIKKQLFVKERLLRNKQETLVKTQEAKNLLAVEQARLQTRKENMEQEAANELGTDFKERITESGNSPVPACVQDKIAKLKQQLTMIGGVDDLTLAEYKETEKRYDYLTSQTADLEKGMTDLRAVIEQLDEEIKKEFQRAFSSISEKFSEYFRILFNGGRATMAVLREKPKEETEDESENEGETPPEQEQPKTLTEKLESRNEIAGVDIKATPPGKKLAGIAALSGGERALTSIAFLCAMLSTFPAPFVVLDEVDAALDEANSIRFGQILGSLAAKTQFITITHNRETMRQSHTLYGVTMGEDGVSRVLSLKLEQAAAYSSKN